MNVLVYNGPGTTPGSVKHVVETLRHFLEPYYAVSTVTAKTLETEPWSSKASAVVFPGGADLPFVKECKPIIPLLKQFVSKQGGVYIGFCAGSYFGSGRVEFAQGNPEMEVTGSRDLKFFKGIARGPAFNGFQYNSELGARAAKLSCLDGLEFSTYYNGGPVFVDADHYDNVEVLARYIEPLDVSYTDSKDRLSIKAPAATILCTVGKGKALLVGAHPEFIPKMLKRSDDAKFISDVVNKLETQEESRLKFMHFILAKAGLTCNTNWEMKREPGLTPIIAATAPDKNYILEDFENNIAKHTSNIENKADHVEFKDQNDTFDLYLGLDKYEQANATLVDKDVIETSKPIILSNKNETFSLPKAAISFNIQKYFDFLSPNNSIGSFLLYGEVVTSTSSLLDNNKTMLSCLPENTVLHLSLIHI